jgi:hypothetical protein
MSTTSIPATVGVLLDHATAAADDGRRALDAGDDQHAAIRLLEASELYRLAAHQLDPNIHPTGVIKID